MKNIIISVFLMAAITLVGLPVLFPGDEENMLTGAITVQAMGTEESSEDAIIIPETLKEENCQSEPQEVQTPPLQQPMVVDECLYKAVQAEASNQGAYGKALVASVIINRVNMVDFPNTVREVIYEPSQFSVVSDGAINRCIPDAETIAAVNGVIMNGPVTNATYFRAGDTGWHKGHLKKLFTFGEHTFYTK